MIRVQASASSPLGVGTGGTVVRIPGLSAYAVAVENGFTGTEAEWLLSLVGPAGPTGPQGAAGPAGANGTNGTDGAPGPNTVSTSTTTSMNGILKGDGSHVAVAVKGTDYDTEIAWLDYDTDTYATVKAAVDAGKMPLCEKDGSIFTYADYSVRNEAGIPVYTYSFVGEITNEGFSVISFWWKMEPIMGNPTYHKSCVSKSFFPGRHASSHALGEDDPIYPSDIGAVEAEQGISHAGDFLVVGSDGNVTTRTLAVWQGGSY